MSASCIFASFVHSAASDTKGGKEPFAARRTDDCCADKLEVEFGKAGTKKVVAAYVFVCNDIPF